MNCGDFKIREITTSGLSHTLDNNLFGVARQFQNFKTPRIFYYSEPMIEYNYANFRFEKSLIKIEIKGPKGEVLDFMTLSLDDLKYEGKSSNICRKLLSDNKVHLFFSFLSK